MLKAIVVLLDQKKKEIGEILAISRSEARKRERANQNPPILALKFVPELAIYVAIYEAQESEVKKQSG